LGVQIYGQILNFSAPSKLQIKYKIQSDNLVNTYKTEHETVSKSIFSLARMNYYSYFCKINVNTLLANNKASGAEQGFIKCDLQTEKRCTSQLRILQIKT
jgi:hypothetical protein